MPDFSIDPELRIRPTGICTTPLLGSIGSVFAASPSRRCHSPSASVLYGGFVLELATEPRRAGSGFWVCDYDYGYGYY